MTKRVGIIGAGIAGLTVGNKLAKKGFQVVVCQAKNCEFEGK
jgi:uncharacterized protein with NAD-binding domain and iron-sulfur cluster